MSGFPIGKAAEVQKGMDHYATPFNSLETAELDVQFSMDPSYGLTRKQYGWATNGTLFDSTFFTENGGTIDIETSGSSGDVAYIRSAYPGQYVSHTVAEPGCALIVPEQYLEYDDDNQVSLTHGEISADIVEWDPATQSGVDSLGISFESDGVYFQLRRENTNIVKVHQSDWNIDTMDGDGPSGRILRPENGYIYNFPFAWYNQGALYLVIHDAETGRHTRVHGISIDGEPSLDTANLPIQVTVESKNTADPIGVRIGGMQYSTHGGGEENRTNRVTEEVRHTSGGAIGASVVTSNNSIDPFAEPGYPLISVRRDGTELLSRVTLPVQVNDLFIDVDQDIWLFAFDEYDPSTALTNQNFTEPEPNRLDKESRILTDTVATDYSPSDAVIRAIQYVSTTRKEVSATSPGGTPRLPLEATLVITAVQAQGSNATDVQPLKALIEEGF